MANDTRDAPLATVAPEPVPHAAAIGHDRGGFGRSAAMRVGLGLACLLVLAALPLFLPVFELELVSAALVLGLLAASVSVMVRAGAISIGHGAFYGVGAYSAALLFTEVTSSAVVGIVMGALGGAVLGALFALLAGRVRGGYLVMLTIALVEVVGTLAESFPDLTGGTDGLLVPPARLGGAGVLTGPVERYWTVLAGAALAISVLAIVLRAPLGKALSALRQSEPRLASAGYNVWLLKIIAWTISGALAGYAGALLVINTRFVSTQETSFATSAIAILVVCIGGSRSIYGVFVAALLVVSVRDYLSALLVGHSQLLLGALFVLFAYAFPMGISTSEVRRRLSGWRRLWHR